MNDLQTLYQIIDNLRNRGIKMKDIADTVGIAPSVLSSLYTTVLPTYCKELKSKEEEEALDVALLTVNNVSKRRLLSSLQDMIRQLQELEPEAEIRVKINPFAGQLLDEIRNSAEKIENISGTYTCYSLSSSCDSLKKEPFLITPSDKDESVHIGRISAHGQEQWGFGIMGDPQNFYCLFNELEAPRFIPVTFYIQIPFFRHPRQLRGIYIGLDYNRNPVARRVVLIKESESTDTEHFKSMPFGLIPKEELKAEELEYYNYTCQTGDYIKMCTVPSLQMDTSDLVKEKKMLQL